MTLFQVVLVPSCLVVAVTVGARTLRGALSRWSGLYWTATWITAALLIAEPTLLTVIARWLGIGRGADLVLYVAVLGGLGTVLYFYSRFRRLEVLVTGVIRREALAAPRRGEASASNVADGIDPNLPGS